MKYIVTWQPEIADAGAYFLTLLDAPPYGPTIYHIMVAAHSKEKLPYSANYTLCSIILATDPKVVW